MKQFKLSTTYKRFLQRLPKPIKIHSLMSRLKLLANDLFPQQCVLCKKTISSAPDLLLCEFCEDTLEPIEEACAVCSIAMSSSESVCGECISTERHWDKCISIYPYTGAVRQLIHKFKYQHDIRLRHTLCSGLIECMQFETDLPDIIIPVPMSKSRLMKRGYNHSLILARFISKSLEIPCTEAIIKTKETQSLAKLKAGERRKIIKNSFSFNSKISKNLLKGKHVAIIDDVVTTGATSTEIARTLKQAKPASISVWCIARA